MSFGWLAVRGRGRGGQRRVSLRVAEWVAGELIAVTLSGLSLVWVWRGHKRAARQAARQHDWRPWPGLPGWLFCPNCPAMKEIKGKGERG